jgi:hypothetical protein
VLNLEDITLESFVAGPNEEKLIDPFLCENAQHMEQLKVLARRERTRLTKRYFRKLRAIIDISNSTEKPISHAQLKALKQTVMEEQKRHDIRKYKREFGSCAVLFGLCLVKFLQAEGRKADESEVKLCTLPNETDLITVDISEGVFDADDDSTDDGSDNEGRTSSGSHRQSDSYSRRDPSSAHLSSSSHGRVLTSSEYSFNRVGYRLCPHCGERGHYSKKCPLLNPDVARFEYPKDKKGFVKTRLPGAEGEEDGYSSGSGAGRKPVQSVQPIDSSKAKTELTERQLSKLRELELIAKEREVQKELEREKAAQRKREQEAMEEAAMRLFTAKSGIKDAKDSKKEKEKEIEKEKEKEKGKEKVKEKERIPEKVEKPIPHPIFSNTFRLLTPSQQANQMKLLRQSALQRRNNKQIGSEYASIGLAESDDDGDSNAEGNGDLTSPNQDDVSSEANDRCTVCGSDDSTPTDLLVYCSGCAFPAHQTCYGLMQLPAGDFFCDACKHKKGLGKHVHCNLCPWTGGLVMKASDKRASITTGSTPETWSHVFCGLSLGSGKVHYTTRTVEFSSVGDKKSSQLHCSVCKMSGGFITTCNVEKVLKSEGKCSAHFHPQCARSKQWYSNYYMDTKVTVSTVVCCAKHSRGYFRHAVTKGVSERQAELGLLPDSSGCSDMDDIPVNEDDLTPALAALAATAAMAAAATANAAGVAVNNDGISPKVLHNKAMKKLISTKNSKNLDWITAQLNDFSARIAVSADSEKDAKHDWDKSVVAFTDAGAISFESFPQQIKSMTRTEWSLTPVIEQQQLDSLVCLTKMHHSLKCGLIADSAHLSSAQQLALFLTHAKHFQLTNGPHLVICQQDRIGGWVQFFRR